MTGEQPYLPAPGSSERSIIKEMINNRDAIHWKHCHTFVALRVYARARNIGRSDQEEIIQDVLYKITRYLPLFRFECTLKSWVHLIIEGCIADKYRKLRNEEWRHVPLINPGDDKEHESEEPSASEGQSTEELFEAHEKIRNGITALLEYTDTHSNPVRDRQIIKMAILEGYTYVETASKVGCDVGVVGYVVREAKRYVREKML